MVSSAATDPRGRSLGPARGLRARRVPGRTLTFEPNENQATPSNTVWVRRRVIIDIWGEQKAEPREEISRGTYHGRTGGSY